MMSRQISINGIQINYTDQGSGTPVVCLHGNPGCVNDFSGCIVNDQYRVIAIDRPGHGNSQRYNATVNHLEEQTKYINAFAEKLGLDTFILVGHSWGAFVALNYAMTFPDKVLSMVLFAPIAFARETVTSPTSGLIKLMQTKLVGKPLTKLLAAAAGKKAITTAMANGFAPAAMPDSYIRETLPVLTRSDSFRAVCEDKGDFEFQVMEKSKNYHQIATKTRIVCGARDSVATRADQAEPLANALQNADLVVLDNMGHQIPHLNKTILKEQLDLLQTA